MFQACIHTCLLDSAKGQTPAAMPLHPSAAFCCPFKPLRCFHSSCELSSTCRCCSPVSLLATALSQQHQPAACRCLLGHGRSSCHAPVCSAARPKQAKCLSAPREDGTSYEQALRRLSAVQRASSAREPASKAQEDLLKFAVQFSTAAGEEEEQKPDLTRSEQWEQLSGFEYALRLCMLEAREEMAHQLVAVRDAHELDAVLWTGEGAICSSV